MTWFGSLLIVLFGAGAFSTIGQVGQERQPIKPWMACVIVAGDVALILGSLLVGTGHV